MIYWAIIQCLSIRLLYNIYIYTVYKVIDKIMTKYKKEKAMRHTSKYYNIYKKERESERYDAVFNFNFSYKIFSVWLFSKKILIVTTILSTRLYKI
jgi:hypothetical protein